MKIQQCTETQAERLRIDSPEVLISPEREEAIAVIIATNLEEVERKYGKEGINPKSYHNTEHTLDVIDAGSLLADAAILTGKINPSEKGLIVIGGSGHDLEQDQGTIKNEQESAKITTERMRKTGLFSEEEIAKVDSMIDGTVVYFDDDGVLRQSPAEDDYLAQLLADADLASLGKSPAVYWDRATRLLKEFKKNPHPSTEELAKFTKEQEIFMKAHRFYTDEARALFPNKEENIRLTAFMRDFYESA